MFHDPIGAFRRKADYNYAEPKDRGLSMVFQNYALYPYMNVYENMAFSLRCAKMDRQEMEQRVHRAADMLQIEQEVSLRPRLRPC